MNTKQLSKDMEIKFIESCIKLGAELLEKKELSNAETFFLENLDNVVDKYVLVNI